MTEVLNQGYGRILTEAREAKGMTVTQVAEKLKLTVRQVEAIEAEDEVRLPAPVFVRGFVRNYARLLGVPQDGLLGIAEVAATPTEHITAHSEELQFTTSPVRRWLLLPVAAFLLFLIVVALLYAWLSRGEEAYVPAKPAVPAETSQAVPLAVPVVPAPAGDATAPTAVLPSSAAPAVVLPPMQTSAAPAVVLPPMQTSAAPAVVLPPMAISAAPAPVAVQAVPARPPAAPATKPLAVQPPIGVPAPVPAAKPPVSQPPAALPVPAPVAKPQAAVPPAALPAKPPRVLQVAAESSDSWVEVVSGDDKRYTRTLRAGEQLTLRGVPPFRVVVGSASGARLSYDGKAIDLKPYTTAEVARLNLE